MKEKDLEQEAREELEKREPINFELEIYNLSAYFHKKKNISDRLAIILMEELTRKMKKFRC